MASQCTTEVHKHLFLNVSVYTNGATTKIPNHSYFVCRVATPKTKTYFYIHVSPAPKVHVHFILVILSALTPHNYNKMPGTLQQSVVCLVKVLRISNRIICRFTGLHIKR